ncbi:MAG: dipeptidase E [Candidatus Saccharimonadales bacterium]|jgi:dipeptidase E
MRLLLTSAGVSNALIADELKGLCTVERPKIAYITTARADSDKDGYLSEQSQLLSKHGLTDHSLVDPTAPDAVWDKMFSGCDVIMIGGGNTYTLLSKFKESGFDRWLVQNKDNFVYVGVSAGSIIFSPDVSVAEIDNGDDNTVNLKDTSGLALIDFEVSPHTPEDVSVRANEYYSNTIENKLVCFDDNSAITVIDGVVKLVGENKFWEFNT